MDVVKILEKLEELKMVRLNRVIGNYYSVYCPFHNDGKERNASCGVLLHDEVRNGQTYHEGLWHCFACGAAKSMPDAITELLKLHNISTASGLEWLRENIGGFEESEFDYLIPRPVVQKLNDKYSINYINKRIGNTPQYIDETELAEYRYTVPYMYERKLTDDVISKFDVGVDLHYKPGNRTKEVPCITFPVKDDKGNVLFIYRRAISSKNFYMPTGLEKPVYGLYELPPTRTSVILCESIFNALTCYVYGYPALALFGTGTQAQIAILKRLGVREFILGLDPDDAGDRGAYKLKKALQSIAIIRRMGIPSGKDINDLSKAEFDEAINTRL